MAFRMASSTTTALEWINDPHLHVCPFHVPLSFHVDSSLSIYILPYPTFTALPPPHPSHTSLSLSLLAESGQYCRVAMSCTPGPVSMPPASEVTGWAPVPWNKDTLTELSECHPKHPERGTLLGYHWCPRSPEYALEIIRHDWPPSLQVQEIMEIK